MWRLKGGTHGVNFVGQPGNLWFVNHVYRGVWKDQLGRTRVDEGLNISTNMRDVLGNGSVKYVVKVKVGQPELVTDILR